MSLVLVAPGGRDLSALRARAALPVARHQFGFQQRAQASDTWLVLVFSKTAGFRHDDSIEAGILAISALGQAHQFQVEAAEDAAVFTPSELARYGAVVFLNTTGDILNTSQQAAFEQYVQSGGGFVGIHSATDTEYDWPWYGQLVGAYFANHPVIQTATIEVGGTSHPSMDGLPARWTRTDEWYNFVARPPASVTILARLDESTYTGGTMGSDHPLVWCHAFAGGRAWYTAMGHTSESFSEPLFLSHLLGGILWAAGQVDLPLHSFLPIMLD